LIQKIGFWQSQRLEFLSGIDDAEAGHVFTWPMQADKKAWMQAPPKPIFESTCVYRR